MKNFLAFLMAASILCSCNNSVNGIDADDHEQPGNSIANNTIRYTAISKVIPNDPAAFGNAHLVSNTFEGGNGILEFDAEITTIGARAFEDCSNLMSITLPNSLKTIGRYAFYLCTGLTNITIPYNVVSIAVEAFGECHALTSFDGKFATTDKRALLSDGSLIAFAPAGLTEYEIPDGVISIEEGLFFGYYNMQRITIPGSVTSVGLAAFSTADANGFSNNLIVYCKPVIPPTVKKEDDVYLCEYNAKIYVPRASVEAYKAAYGWKKHSSQIEGYDF